MKIWIRYQIALLKHNYKCIWAFILLCVTFATFEWVLTLELQFMVPVGIILGWIFNKFYRLNFWKIK